MMPENYRRDYMLKTYLILRDGTDKEIVDRLMEQITIFGTGEVKPMGDVIEAKTTSTSIVCIPSRLSNEDICGDFKLQEGKWEQLILPMRTDQELLRENIDVSILATGKKLQRQFKLSGLIVEPNRKARRKARRKSK